MLKALVHAGKVKQDGLKKQVLYWNGTNMTPWWGTEASEDNAWGFPVKDPLNSSTWHSPRAVAVPATQGRGLPEG